MSYERQPNYSPNAVNGLRKLCVALVACVLLVGCGDQGSDGTLLTQNTKVVLMDWHIAGLWVINCPVVWVRVYNYNPVPIKEITFEYSTYTDDGRALDTGTFTIEGSVDPHNSKNFVELYVGLVDLYSQRLNIKLLSVKRA